MEEKIDDIENIFKRGLEDMVAEKDTSSWAKLESRLEDRIFYQLDLRHFNIYYASLIFIAVLFSTYLMVNHFINSDSKENSVSHKTFEGNNYNQIKKSDVKNYSSTDSISLKTDTHNFDKEQKEKLKTDRGSGVIKTQKSNSSDTINPTTVVQQQLENKKESIRAEEENKEVENNKIYITHQDTLLLIDTLHESISKKAKKVRKNYGK